jgi:outer membrane protein insertion porin family
LSSPALTAVAIVGRGISLWILLAITLPSPALYASPGATVRNLRISGATAFTPREISSWLTLRSGAVFSLSASRADSDAIVKRFRKEGFLDAQASVRVQYDSDSSAVDIVISIEERRKTVIGALAIAGNVFLPTEELRSSLDSREGSPLDETTLEADVAAILTRYEKAGYPTARCSIDSLSLSSGGTVDSIHIVLRIEEGPALRIQEIRVEGNKETGTDVIVRESRIRMGELYDPDRMRDVKQRLLRLNIFAAVGEPELYMHKESGGVMIRVQEGSTNTFDGIAGYMPGNGVGDDGYFTGLVSVSMRNLFGTARKFQFRWQKEDRHSQELSLGYVEPWVLGVPLNLGFEFLQRRQDSAYVRQGGSLRAEWMFSDVLSMSLIGSTEAVIPSADSTASRVPRSSTTSGGVEVVYDTRDDLFSPSRGARYRADYHYGRKSVDDAGESAGRSSTVQRFTVDLDSYFPVFARQVAVVGLHGRQVEGAAIDESEMFRLGGTNNLRGYRENQFVGSRVGWTSLEYRLLLARHSFISVFLDAGYYSRPANERQGLLAAESFLYGYGIGLRFDSPLGNLGVSFALGRGDSFAQGKVHFGIINEF